VGLGTDALGLFVRTGADLGMTGPSTSAPFPLMPDPVQLYLDTTVQPTSCIARRAGTTAQLSLPTDTELPELLEIGGIGATATFDSITIFAPQ
jgi:hypothetical protein